MLLRCAGGEQPKFRKRSGDPASLIAILTEHVDDFILIETTAAEILAALEKILTPLTLGLKT
jgi:hypothetical protein